MRRVAITGIGAVTPLGVGAPALHERWSAGESGIEDGLARCSEFEATDHLTRRQARRTDRFTQLALVAAAEAISSAGLDEAPYDRAEIGSVIGTGIGGLSTIESEHITLLDQGQGKVSPHCVPQMMANSASGALAIEHDLRGQCFGTVSACAAGAHAVGTAARMISYGDAIACVTGGAESAMTPLATAAFAEMGATSKSGISRPFDRRRDGFVMGEGAGVLVLEDAETAELRGAPILGYVAGYGATADAHHMTAPEPSGDGAARAIRKALADAEIEPGAIAYVNAHGTSTPLNDRSETEALKTALGDAGLQDPDLVDQVRDRAPARRGGSRRGDRDAAGAPGQAGPSDSQLRGARRGTRPRLRPGKAKALPLNGHPAVGISNSFGFGGHNVVLCIEAAA